MKKRQRLYLFESDKPVTLIYFIVGKKCENLIYRKSYQTWKTFWKIICKNFKVKWGGCKQKKTLSPKLHSETVFQNYFRPENEFFSSIQPKFLLMFFLLP